MDETPLPVFRAWTRAMWLLAGAALHGISFPPIEQAWSAWLVPLCWIAGLERAGTRTRVFGLFAAGYFASAAGLSWLWGEFGPAAVSLWAITAVYFAAWGAMLGAARRGPPALALAWPAVAWCALEYLRGEVAPLRFSWLALGYSQQNAIGAALAAVVGVYGVSFALVLWASAVVAARRLRGRRRVATLMVLAAVPVSSLVPRAPVSVPETAPWVLLGQSVEALDMGDGPPRAIAAATPEEPAELIVWPEYSIFGDPRRPTYRWFLDIARASAATARRGLVFGAKDIAPGLPSRTADFQNTAFLMAPDGTIAGQAGKSQPVHLISDGRPAPDVAVLDLPGTPSRRVGVGVCFDGAYQQFARRMAARGATALVFPTYNKLEWGGTQHRQHQRMFQMRAAETVLEVLCSAHAGPTFAAAPGGRILAELPFGVPGALRAPLLPAPGGTTWFVQLGWLMGPASLLACAVGLVARFGRLSG